MSRRLVASEHDASTLAACPREIAKLPRLTADEERALGAHIQHDRDDDAAIARLVEANLQCVVSCAKRYRGQSRAKGKLRLSSKIHSHLN